MSNMDYLKDEKLLEMLDDILLTLEPKTKKLVEHLFTEHWNETIGGKQEGVIMAITSWVSEYGQARKQELSVDVAIQVALGKVMQVPMVQQMLQEIMRMDFERRFS